MADEPISDNRDAICAICGEWLHVFKDNILVHGSAAMLERCQILEKRLGK